MDKKALAQVALNYYQCTFFFPLVGLLEKDFSPKPEFLYPYCPDSPNLTSAEKQAYHYFSPTLRDILFECEESKNAKIEPVREWRLPEIEVAPLGLYLEPQEGADKPSHPQTIKTSIEEVRLFRYFNGIYVLSYRVVAENISQQSDLETWLHFTRLARLLYPSFPEQVAENKIAPLRIYGESEDPLVTAFDEPSIDIPQHKGEKLSGIIRFFLKQFAVHSDPLDKVLNHYDKLYDDRMFVSVAYGLKDKLVDDDLQQVVYLATWVDRTEDFINDHDQSVYGKAILKEMTKDKLFTLWEDQGGVFGFTDYSNAYIYNGWFFNHIIAPNHIPYIYDRMLVQALFYQASLRFYDEQISLETGSLVETQSVDIRRQRNQFIRFTNQYWFHSLTNQMQGRRIFELQTQGLALQKHYDIIKDELERTDEYLQSENSAKIETLTTRLTYGGLILGFLALYYTLLPLIDSAIKASNAESSLWKYIDTWGCWIPSGFLLLVIPLVVVAIPFLLRYFYKRRK